MRLLLSFLSSRGLETDGGCSIYDGTTCYCKPSHRSLALLKNAAARKVVENHINSLFHHTVFQPFIPGQHMDRAILYPSKNTLLIPVLNSYQPLAYLRAS